MKKTTDTMRYKLRRKTELPLSTGLKKAYEKAKILAQTDDNILLIGETGTGKNFLASNISLIHPKYKNHFIEVISTAVPHPLFESVLFGYVKGAFTGAMQDTLGKVHIAHNGTLFLDEIAEIPIDLQVKLLQFVEQRRFYRVGSTKMENVDIRIICATNKSLEELKNSKNFRQDLLYRFMSPIELPPLREGGSDYILKLLEHLIFEYAPIYSRAKEVTVEPDVLNSLLKYPWPGNIRELKSIVKEMLALSSPNTLIKAHHVPKCVSQYSQPIKNPLDNLEFTNKSNLPTMQQIKNAYAQKVYRICNQNITHTANQLQIHRNTLKQMIRSWDYEKSQ